MRYEFLFDDGSLLSVPEPWRDTYQRYFGASDPAGLEGWMRLITAKYREQKAIPSKFDGILCEEEGDAKYDNPAYYGELWDESREYRDEPPSMAEIAENVLYQSMRVGLKQKALDDYAAEHGTKPVRVVTPDTLLRDLVQHESDGEAKR